MLRAKIAPHNNLLHNELVDLFEEEPIVPASSPWPSPDADLLGGGDDWWLVACMDLAPRPLARLRRGLPERRGGHRRPRRQYRARPGLSRLPLLDVLASLH